MNEYYTLFLVGVFSDLGLNYLSRLEYSPEEITSLREYFDYEGIISAAVKAGITTLICGRVSNMIAPDSLFYKAVSGYSVGYVADWIIYKCNVFGEKLNEYYESAGVGFWGGAAIAFAVVSTEFIKSTNVN